jgi:hypothetical protein
VLSLLPVLSRALAPGATGPDSRGVCAACLRPVLATETASRTRSNLYHTDCLHYRRGNRAKRLPWRR